MMKRTRINNHNDAKLWVIYRRGVVKGEPATLTPSCFAIWPRLLYHRGPAPVFDVLSPSCFTTARCLPLIWPAPPLLIVNRFQFSFKEVGGGRVQINKYFNIQHLFDILTTWSPSCRVPCPGSRLPSFGHLFSFFSSFIDLLLTSNTRWSNWPFRFV